MATLKALVIQTAKTDSRFEIRYPDNPHDLVVPTLEVGDQTSMERLSRGAQKLASRTHRLGI